LSPAFNFVTDTPAHPPSTENIHNNVANLTDPTWSLLRNEAKTQSDPDLRPARSDKAAKLFGLRYYKLRIFLDKWLKTFMQSKRILSLYIQIATGG
jgi:hypothetical protein